MAVTEIRDLDEARVYVLQGLWLQRTVTPTPSTVKPALEWALEIVSNGQPLPPVGMVADFGHVALGLDRDPTAKRTALVIPRWTKELAPRYEDYVLGKVYADWSFERAGDALRRFAGPERERNRRRGLAYIIQQFHKRAEFTAVELAPGVIRGLLDRKSDEVLADGWTALSDGPMPLLCQIYQELIAAGRRLAEILSEVEVSALEKGIALADMGQYVAYEQVFRMSKQLEDCLPRQKVRPLHGRQEVPTRVLDEDTYPVGGFSSISTRGSIESMLFSQLAYMEPPGSGPGPDLFDIKYLRDELYYYARDENQFLRRRRSFVFVLTAGLSQARFKDAELPCQRIVLILSLLFASVRKLSEWLSTDAIRFEFFFTGGADSLAHEYNLLEMLLREQIENGSVILTRRDELYDNKFSDQEVVHQHCQRLARRSLCHCLLIQTEPTEVASEDAVMSQLVVNGPRPAISTGYHPPKPLESDDAQESWAETLHYLLQLYV